MEIFLLFLGVYWLIGVGVIVGGIYMEGDELSLGELLAIMLLFAWFWFVTVPEFCRIVFTRLHKIKVFKARTD